MNTHEHQLTFIGRQREDLDYTLCQFKIPLELKRDISLWCHSKGLTLSAYLRMCILKTLEDERTMHDPRTIAPIENTVRELQELLPILIRYGSHKNY